MSTLTNNALGLEEVAKRTDPSGDTARIAEVLVEQNDILKDAIWLEANDLFSNKTTRRSDEPSGTWRKLNTGVAHEASKTTVMWDTIGLLETYAENDVEVINSHRDPVFARQQENNSFVNGLGKTMASTIIYGNTNTTPEKFMGLAPRLDSTSDTMVQGAGGTGSDVTSIYIVDWGTDTVYMTYPRNSKAGLVHEDLGIQTVRDSSNNKFQAYVDHFVWKAGLVVRNPRSIARVANIETSGTSNIFDEDDLIKLLVQMTSGPGLRIYVNRTIMAQMWIAQKDKSNIFYSVREGLAGGGPVLHFNDIPVRRVDQILDTESAIS